MLDMERDWLDISIKVAAIVIPSLVAWLIGNQIQKKLDSEKSLRTHMINEILEVRNMYRTIVDKVKSGTSQPRFLKSELSIMSAHITDLITLVQSRHKDVSKDFFLPYQLEFSQIITDDNNYISSFQDNNYFSVTPVTHNALTLFERSNHHLFNDLILIIYK